MSHDEKKYSILHLNSGRRWIGEVAHAIFLCKLLKERGHKIILGCRRDSIIDKTKSDLAIDIDLFNMTSHFSFRSDWADIKHIIKVVEENDIEIIHVHRGKEHWLAMIAMLFMKKRLPIIRTRHVVMPTKQHILNRWLFKNTNEMICVSEVIRHGYKDFAEIPIEKMSVVLGAVDLQKFHPVEDRAGMRKEFGLEEDIIYVGMVGRLRPIKGHSHFLRACRLVLAAYPNVRFVLAGEGKMENDINQWLDELELRPHFELRGHLGNVEKLCAVLDVGVIASTGSEGFSRVAVEYLASGVPVVATAVGALPEIINEDKNGYLTPHSDAVTMAEKIMYLLSDENRRATMATQARKDAEENFSFDRWVGDIEKVYNKVMHGASDE